METPPACTGLPSTAGYKGQFASGEIYSSLGLQGPTNNSNNFFPNWSTGTFEVTGVPVDPLVGYGIYVFDLLASLAGGALLDIELSSSVPPGSILVAYTQRPTSNPGFQPLEVPWTEGGLQNVPEPATLTLVGAGLVGLGCWRRRRAE